MVIRGELISRQGRDSLDTSLLVKEHTGLVRNDQIRDFILAFEERLAKVPGAAFGDNIAPLKHTFVDGAYVREIFMPKGMALTSKIHKVTHPYFIMKGDVSVLTEGGVVRLKAPYSGITPAGTKRLLYIHEDTTWITVHVTKEKDLKKIEEEIIATNFKEVPEDAIEGEVFRIIEGGTKCLGEL
jgi:hypothetical protein